MFHYQPRIKRLTFVNYPEQWVDVIVNPTRKQVKAVQAAAKAEGDAPIETEVLQYIAAWSFADDKGTVLPIEVESLDELPQDIYDSMFARWRREVDKGSEADPN